jgi:hypothetical protein
MLPHPPHLLQTDCFAFDGASTPLVSVVLPRTSQPPISYILESHLQSFAYMFYSKLTVAKCQKKTQ